MKRFALIMTLAGLFGLGAYQAQATTPQDAGGPPPTRPSPSPTPFCVSVHSKGL